MEGRGHVIIMREIIKGEDSPVERYGVKEERSRRKSLVERQVSRNRSLHVREQSVSKVNILWRQGRRHDKGRKL